MIRACHLIWCSLITVLLALACLLVYDLDLLVHEARATVARGGGLADVLQQRAEELRPVTTSLTSASRDVAAMTAQARTAAPLAARRVEKGTFYLWKHADQTLGHLDAMSGDWREQQKRVADKSLDTLTNVNAQVSAMGDLFRSGNLLVTDINKIVVSPSFQDFLDGMTITSVNLGKTSADFYKWQHKYTNPTPYTGKHPKWHAVGIGVKAGSELLPVGANFMRILSGTGK